MNEKNKGMMKKKIMMKMRTKVIKKTSVCVCVYEDDSGRGLRLGRAVKERALSVRATLEMSFA